MNALMPLLRHGKHAGFVMSKRLKVRTREARFRMVTVAARLAGERRPYRFDPQRYRRSFLVRPTPALGGVSDLPRRVFVVWTGENGLTDNRRRNLALLRERICVPVELITPDTLPRWIVADHPLHDAYESLSLVHRSDYLRAYLLHHHGGGYADLKAPLHSWSEVFDAAEQDPDAWVIGFRELSAATAVRLPGALGFDIAFHHRRLAGNSAFIVRSHTPFTAEWLREVERRMDYFGPQMEEFPGAVRGEVVGYPVSWTDLLGKIFQPLQLKYLDHVRIDDRLLMEFTDYQ